MKRTIDPELDDLLEAGCDGPAVGLEGEEDVTKPMVVNPLPPPSMDDRAGVIRLAASGLHANEIIVDLFAGGGGASEGIKRALGREPHVAVNHDPEAIRMHSINHPGTIHYQTSVYEVDPVEASGGRDVGLLWLSPDCRHFSRAKGGVPVSPQVRSLAWVGIDWAEKARPRVICLENVPEFLEWGPLGPDNRPDRTRKGETFAEFTGRLKELGYQVDWRVLNAADYGAPTARRRLFLVARRDGLAPAWPKATHGEGCEFAQRTAAECIDWDVPCPSIFARGRPLADASSVRIATGTTRYVLNAADPYFAPVRPSPDDHRQAASAWLAKYYTGVVGSDLRKPMGTVTAIDHHGLVVARMAKEPLSDLERDGALRTAAFIVKYYREGGQWQGCEEPLHTITTRGRLGLVTVTVAGQDPYIVTDIGMRMLTPVELARAQGFPQDYRLVGTKTSQIARIGNSVAPDAAAALVRAQFGRATAA